MRIQEWNKKFQELLKRMPPGYWLFVGGGTLYLMRCGKKDKHVHLPNYGVDPKYLVRTFTNIDIDGGDW
jgi:hypothetical protein